MTIHEMHAEFKKRLNRLDSNHYLDVEPHVLDSYINAAQEYLLMRFYDKIKDSLTVRYPDQPSLDPIVVEQGRYIYDMGSLKYDMYKIRQAYYECDGKRYDVTIIEDKEQWMHYNRFTRPNSRWKRLLGQFGYMGGKYVLVVYTDGQQVGDGKLYVEYVKKPKEVFYGGYDSVKYLICVDEGGVDCDQYYNSTSPAQHSDIHQSLHSLIVDIAVWMSGGSINAQEAVRTFGMSSEQVLSNFAESA
ncbi:MAG: hypothetical protein KatS3mg054_0054 [Chloroflexus sp.]|nr:MAG: hypothetical protein KatS3mg054_0054 [Chloroflexus sp.]